jgi:RNA polymerase sigma factor for flagellar operon FliA
MTGNAVPPERDGNPAPVRATTDGARREVTDVLWARYVRHRDLSARDALLEQYIGLVHHAAREVAHQIPKALDLDDLVGAGTLGLVQALENFDPDRGFAFSSFAVPRIRGAIIDEIRSWDWVPRTARERGRRMRRTAEDLRHRLAREPRADEMAEALGMDLDDYLRHAGDARGPVLMPLDGGGGETGDGPHLSEVLPDPTALENFQRLEKTETMAALAEAFEALSDRDRIILTLSFFERLTLREIGEVLHVTESRVSQLRTRALARLQESIQSREKAA